MNDRHPIDAILKKLAAATPSGKNEEGAAELRSVVEARPASLPGDPNCPHCHGIGYLRQDLPVGHPDFGRLQLCACRQGEASQKVYKRLFALSRLDELQHLTFENFQPRGRMGLPMNLADKLEYAYNQASQYAQSLKGWLLLQGGYGCGKTHLAAAIGNFVVNLGVPTLFLTVPDLLDSLRFAYDDPESTFEARFEEIRSAPLLIMDDFGTQNATAWAQEKLFQILNYRYINHLPLVVTTNLMLEEIESRIRSRLEDPELVTSVFIPAPDYRRPKDYSGHSDMSSLKILDYHFSDFYLRQNEGLPSDHIESLKQAKEVAQAFAREPDGWLVITGAFGCGKTHLAAAIANECTQAYKSWGAMPLFVSVPDLMDHLRATFHPESRTTFDRRFDEICSTRLVILDDLRTKSISSWVREKLYQLFEYRYHARLPTVITTPEFIDEIDERLRSRLRDARLCRVVGITAPAYRGGGGGQRKTSTRRKPAA